MCSETATSCRMQLQNMVSYMRQEPLEEIHRGTTGRRSHKRRGKSAPALQSNDTAPARISHKLLLRQHTIALNARSATLFRGTNLTIICVRSIAQRKLGQCLEPQLELSDPPDPQEAS